MTILQEKTKIDKILALLPEKAALEIERLARGRRGGLSAIREIRIRRSGVCSIVIGRESLRLFAGIDSEEMATLVDRLTDGAMYAHRDSISSGYISMWGGIRVGICGRAAYDGGRLVGVGDMSSLLFRIPTGECAFGEELYSVFCSGIGQGMLIYSPPGVGKTTALRSLAARVGSGNRPLRVAVVDERCEFDPSDFSGCEVDILSGYKRSLGVEIATRTLSPELIIIDEIGAEDGEALLQVVKCGLPIVATAHAGSKAELLSRPSLKGLFDLSVFSMAVGISCSDGKYALTVDKL